MSLSVWDVISLSDYTYIFMLALMSVIILLIGYLIYIVRLVYLTKGERDRSILVIKQKRKLSSSDDLAKELQTYCIKAKHCSRRYLISALVIGVGATLFELSIKIYDVIQASKLVHESGSLDYESMSVRLLLTLVPAGTSLLFIAGQMFVKKIIDRFFSEDILKNVIKN